MRYLILSLSFISIISFADDHAKETNFPGLVSTETFNLGNGMEMHVERRNSCNQDGTPKHFHPAAGTLVYVLDGTSQSGFVCSYANIEKYTEIQKQWKKEKSAIITNPKAYSALYVINSRSLNKDVEFNVESGAQKGEISKAFKRMLGNKSTNKKLLSSFIGYVS